MARFGFLLPRAEMVEPAGRIAAELEMDVVLNRWVRTDEILTAAAECVARGADIIVARGRQASILKESTSLPVVEIQLTGQELALLLKRAKMLLQEEEHPKVGLVTLPNLIGNIDHFGDIFEVELHTYFWSRPNEIEEQVERAIMDGMQVILGGDLVLAHCEGLEVGPKTLFFDSTEDSIRTSLRHAKNVGSVSDMERRNTAHLQVLLDYSFNGILELNTQGTILQANDVACKILEMSKEQLMGRSLLSLMLPEDYALWDDTLAHRQELYYTALNLCGTRVVANAAPVGNWDLADGIILSFHEIDRIKDQGSQAMKERNRFLHYLAKGRFEKLLYESRVMKKTIQMAQTFASTEFPVVIQGEVGSGKSSFAQSIHNDSLCSEGPFVTFNCGEYEDDQSNILSRAIKQANGGTLYLDKLDCLSPAGQHMICRLIRDRTVQSKEEATPVRVQVRIIVSLIDNLTELNAAGTILPELYYHISPLQLKIPPLRERPEDLRRLIDICLADSIKLFDRYVVLTKDSKELLLKYPWPGNYIQLRSFLERLTLTASSRTIHHDYVQRLLNDLYPEPGSDDQTSLSTQALSPEEMRIVEALTACNGSREKAAKALGISTTTLWRRMKKYGLNS